MSFLVARRASPVATVCTLGLAMLAGCAEVPEGDTPLGRGGQMGGPYDPPDAGAARVTRDAAVEAGVQPPAADAGDGATVLEKGLTAQQKRKAELLTSVWENSTTVLQYAFSADIGDGRGYTSGRAGFATGTGDAAVVVRCFDTAFGTGAQNKLHKYLVELTRLEGLYKSTGRAQGFTATLQGLGNYRSDWASSANDGATSAAFRGCQDAFVEQLYYAPAMALADSFGLQTALTRAALYDTAVNHGTNGMADLVAGANTDMGNAAQTPAATPLSAIAESAWLEKLTLRRLAVMKADPTWAEAVDRAAFYGRERTAGNWDLGANLVTDAKARLLYPGKGYADSGYPRCVIAPDGTVSGDALCTSPTGS